MKTTQLSLPGSETKSGLRSSILALTVILSAVSTGLTQESVSSDLSTNAALPKNQLAVGNQVSVKSPVAIAVASTNTLAYAVGTYPSGNGEEGAVYVIDISP